MPRSEFKGSWTALITPFKENGSVDFAGLEKNIEFQTDQGITGILAVGTIEKRVVPLEDGPGVRDMMTIALAVDHRAVDGTYAAEFLNRIKHYLENIHKTIVSSQE